MHQPCAEPRQSIYYRYRVHQPWLPSAHPGEQRHADGERDDGEDCALPERHRQRQHGDHREEDEHRRHSQPTVRRRRRVDPERQAVQR